MPGVEAVETLLMMMDDGPGRGLRDDEVLDFRYGHQLHLRGDLLETPLPGSLAPKRLDLQEAGHGLAEVANNTYPGQRGDPSLGQDTNSGKTI